jgi:hypothetical protein
MWVIALQGRIAKRPKSAVVAKPKAPGKTGRGKPKLRSNLNVAKIKNTKALNMTNLTAMPPDAQRAFKSSEMLLIFSNHQRSFSQ